LRPLCNSYFRWYNNTNSKACQVYRWYKICHKNKEQKEVQTTMRDTFYINNHMSAPLEAFIGRCDSFDDFEKRFSDEFLNEDSRIGNYLGQLLN